MESPKSLNESAIDELIEALNQQINSLSRSEVLKAEQCSNRASELAQMIGSESLIDKDHAKAAELKSLYNKLEMMLLERKQFVSQEMAGMRKNRNVIGKYKQRF